MRLTTDALGTLVRSRYRSFYVMAFRLMGNREDAEDVIQDAFLLAFRKFEQFRGQSTLATWVGAIVINCARMQRRRGLRRHIVSLDAPIDGTEGIALSEIIIDPEASPEELVSRRQRAKLIRAFLPSIAPRYREVIELRFGQEMSTREVALQLRAPEGTVKTRVARGKAQLKDRLRSCITA